MLALSINNLRKTYASGVCALDGVDLEVKEGDFFALLGPNGAGKSTAIGVVSSLITKTTGKVEVFGKDQDQYPEEVKAAIGLVPQEFNCNQFEPCIEILVNQAGYYGIGRREAYQRAEYCLRQLNLWEKRRTISRQLSGGMKRRLMIARALVHRPRLLILDEPTAGVDIEVRRAIWYFMREINREGTTIILTTHYLEEAETLCRTIAIIDDGVIIAHCSMAEMLNQLHRETFVLNLREELAELPELGSYLFQRLDAHTLEVSVLREQSINGLFDALSRQGIEVISLRNKQNRLEQLFIDMLGGGHAGGTPA